MLAKRYTGAQSQNGDSSPARKVQNSTFKLYTIKVRKLNTEKSMTQKIYVAL